jgi:hypothetical protein
LKGQFGRKLGIFKFTAASYRLIRPNHTGLLTMHYAPNFIHILCFSVHPIAVV